MRWAEQIVKEWVSRWDDQRLMEVLAFNEDGKMHYGHCCDCLLGVTTAAVLHQHDSLATGLPCPLYNGPIYKHHYLVAKNLPGAIHAEGAYETLGWYRVLRFFPVSGGDALRRQRLDKILREVITEREEARRQTVPDPELSHGCAGLVHVEHCRNCKGFCAKSKAPSEVVGITSGKLAGRRRKLTL